MYPTPVTDLHFTGYNDSDISKLLFGMNCWLTCQQVFIQQPGVHCQAKTALSPWSLGTL